MLTYRFYEITEVGWRRPAIDLPCCTDEVAIAMARAMQNAGSGVEVWLGTRFVHRAVPGSVEGGGMRSAGRGWPGG